MNGEDYPWQFKSDAFRAKEQLLLFRGVQKLFANEEILCDYKHPQLSFTTNNKMELDIYIPSLSLAFEYQGQQHYESCSTEGSEVCS
jgi:hypothetical protein